MKKKPDYIKLRGRKFPPTGLGGGGAYSDPTQKIVPQGQDFPFDPDLLTLFKYGKGLTHDQRYRPASSQSVSDFGNDMGGADAMIGEDWFLGSMKKPPVE